MLTRKHCVLAGAVLVLVCSNRGAGAQTPAGPSVPPPAALLRQLDKVSLDPSQVYVLRHARLERGGVSFYFDRGFIGFFEPVHGEVTGAVFAGNGEVLLMPPDGVERRSLAQFTGSAILEEQFDFAYMRFTGHEARDLRALSRRPDPQDPEQPGDFAGRSNPALVRLNPAYSVRVMEDLLGEKDRPFFAVQLHGLHLGMFNVTDDERLPENIVVTAVKRQQGMTYTDMWCSYASAKSRARPSGGGLEAGNVRALSYDIRTRIREDNSLEGRTVVDLESHSNEDRVLIFRLSSRLHVLSVKDEKGRELAVLLPTGEDGNDGGGRSADWVAVVLPTPYPEGTKFRLAFTYAGSVITDVGNGVLYVGARESWYPNVGPYARAPYVLDFEYPESLTLVATGRRLDEGSAGGWKHSRWASDGAFPVVGFNLGAYRERTRQVGSVRVEVYATPDAEAALVKRLASQAPAAPLEYQQRLGGRNVPLQVLQTPPVALDPAALLDRVADRAARAVRYFETLFGPFPYPRMALSQIPGNFGQGWPELVYLPTLSFFAGGESLSIPAARDPQGLEEQLYVSHEIAHQWWGNEVGWKTYHDQWLSEGFASYAAALELAREKDGARKFRQLLRQYKQDLLSKTPAGKTVESGGPIWLGWRLSNSLNPRGYDAIVYKKACWVLHMLRSLMTDPRTGSDARFFKMLRDFEETYRDRAPSTRDFIVVANRYMTPQLDLDRHHGLDWFFTDWVYNTGIPIYKIRSTTRRLKNGGYLSDGTIEQSEVPDGFEMLVPLVATSGKDKKITLGRVAVGPRGHFSFTTSFKPARISVDEDELLARVE
jgi:Peptidase family M1 domain